MTVGSPLKSVPEVLEIKVKPALLPADSSEVTSDVLSGAAIVGSPVGVTSIILVHRPRYSLTDLFGVGVSRIHANLIGATHHPRYARLDLNKAVLAAVLVASVCLIVGLAVAVWQSSKTQELTLAAGAPSGESYLIGNALKKIVERHYPRSTSICWRPEHSREFADAGGRTGAASDCAGGHRTRKARKERRRSV